MRKNNLIKRCRILVNISILSLLTLMLVSCASSPVIGRSDITTDPLMGDWQGVQKSADGKSSPVAAQVMAVGKDGYRVNILKEFDTRAEPLTVLEGSISNGKIRFPDNPTAVITKGKFTGKLEGNITFEMRKLVRLSPMLGAQPGQGALVLFDGTQKSITANWLSVKDRTPAKWKLVADAMEVVPKTGSIITKKKFRDYMLHMEFRSPFTPALQGQKRGNSGVYHQCHYEVQILDSYSLEGRDNECGGIYKVAVPRVNMCAPPGQWQSYDIIFHAPRFNADGNKTKNARITVIHNGVIIHDNQQIPLPTGGALDKKETEYGSLMLQDHGDKVQYRNIWLVELR